MPPGSLRTPPRSRLGASKTLPESVSEPPRRLRGRSWTLSNACMEGNFVPYTFRPHTVYFRPRTIYTATHPTRNPHFGFRRHLDIDHYAFRLGTVNAQATRCIHSHLTQYILIPPIVYVQVLSQSTPKSKLYLPSYAKCTF